MTNLSVVIPFHNEIKLIRRATDSVIENSKELHSLEIILCNDGKYTESEIRQNISNTANIALKVIKNRYSKGPGGARNTGLDVSTGRIIAFLDADDYWLPGKINAQLQAVHQGATFVATGYKFDTGKTTIYPPDIIDKPIDVFLRRGIGTSTVLVTRDLVEQNRFKDIRFSQDIDYWFTLANSPVFRYARIREPLVEYSTNGSTKNKWQQLKYLNIVLSLNEVKFLERTRILANYIATGIYNHYIKKL